MHGHIRERKEIPNYVSFYAEAYIYYSWLVAFSGEMIIYAFLLGFFSLSHKKEWYEC